MKRWLIPFAIPIVIVASYLTVFKHQTYFTNAKSDSSEIFAYKEGKNSNSEAQTNNNSTNLPKQMTDKSNLVGELAYKLHIQYGPSINLISTQAGLVVFKRQLSLRETEQSEILFKNIINKAFPEHSQNISRVVQLIEIYIKWLKENNMFSDFSDEERKKALWNKRHQLFGNDAELIWSYDRDTDMLSRFKLQDSLFELDSETELSYNSKLEKLKSVFSTQFQNLVPKDNSAHFFLSQVFFNLDSVQIYLQGMNESKRQNEIDTARKRLDFSEQQTAKLRQKDELFNLAWNRGQEYEADISRLEQQVKNLAIDLAEALELREDARTKYFGKDADEIAKEESFGYRRFQNKQTFGVY